MTVVQGVVVAEQQARPDVDETEDLHDGFIQPTRPERGAMNAFVKRVEQSRQDKSVEHDRRNDPARARRQVHQIARATDHREVNGEVEEAWPILPFQVGLDLLPGQH